MVGLECELKTVHLLLSHFGSSEHHLHGGLTRPDGEATVRPNTPVCGPKQGLSNNATSWTRRSSTQINYDSHLAAEFVLLPPNNGYQSVDLASIRSSCVVNPGHDELLRLLDHRSQAWSSGAGVGSLVENLGAECGASQPMASDCRVCFFASLVGD